MISIMMSNQLHDLHIKTGVTIRNILRGKSNDYSPVEKIFFDYYGSELCSWKAIHDRTFTKKVSVIIPSHNSVGTLPGTLLSISNQKLTKIEVSLVEVIVVDDGSTDGTEDEIKKIELNFEFKYIKQVRGGRGVARNVGVAASSGEILIFLDSDILIEENFIKEHMLRHECIGNSVFVGFRENIHLESGDAIKFVLSGMKPDIGTDFRFFKHVGLDWTRMHRHVSDTKYGDIRILDETRNFKDFGMDRVCGVWDLPSMVITHSVSLKKQDFFECGGFNLGFNGWGMEDTFFGACLISLGNYVIPIFSTGAFHVAHDSRSGSRMQKMKEFHTNVSVYLDLIKHPCPKRIE